MNVGREEKTVLFDEFFDMGMEDHLSPFLTPRSRRWGRNLHLKASIIATLFLIAAFFLHFFPKGGAVSQLLLVGVYFFAGVPALIESVEDIAKLEINIDVLMTLAAFSSVLIGSPMEGGMLLVLFALSGSMEEAVTEKAKGAISSLYKLAPSTAWLLTPEGKLVERAVEDIEVGETLLIKAGEVVPLDGRVVEGTSSLNLVHLTGESAPILKQKGDEVPAGGQNLEGSLTVEVTHTKGDSTVARIIDLVTTAQEARPRVQKWFDKLSRPYAMAVIGLTLFFGLTLPLLGVPYLGEEGAIYRAVAFMIAASPCALIIATPIAYLSSINACARKGILLKGGVTLDALAMCDVFAFDKTGTLTTGELHVTGITSVNGDGDTALALQAAATLERHAVHPIAKAILHSGEEKGLPPFAMRNFRSVPGFGVEGELQVGEEWQKAWVGNPAFILEKIVEKRELEEMASRAKEEGQIVTVLLLGEALYLFTFADTLRPHIERSLSDLRKGGYARLVMLTGDHYNSARHIAATLGIEEFHADLRPEDKLRLVSEMAGKEGLAMVGDGVNDAPALARATVGISMGKGGSNTAIEAADVVLLHDNLEWMAWLMRKAHQTKKIVRQNLTLASSVILFATTPALLGFVPLWLAVILHEGGTVLVGLNALRLLEK